MLPRRRQRDAPVAAAGDIFQQCYFCEPGLIRRDQVCVSVALLDGLKDDLAEISARVAAEEETNGVARAMRKGARYLMYRKWVGEKWGYLGRGKRIRIPPCVVEAIRSEFREPGCECELGGPLFNCVAHGYTGHRD